MRVVGSVGALANRLEFAGLHQRLRNARPVSVHPLLAEARQRDGTVKIRALNEIVLMRQKLQAAKLHTSIAEAKLSADLTGDGLLAATPLGSTGYNLSAGGASLQHGSASLAPTGLAVHRRSDCSNMVLSDQTIIEVDVRSPDHRPVRLETTMQTLDNVMRVRVACQHDTAAILLLDPA
jgi:NAD+ kinase